MMMIKLKFRMLLVALLALPGASFSQYFNHLYDYDSTSDWGFNVFVQQDGSYCVIGHTSKTRLGITGYKISSDGKHILDRNQLVYDSNDVYRGMSGRAKKLQNNYYLIPYTLARPHPGPNIDWYQLSGFIIMDDNGDTIKSRLYTDTSKWADFMHDCYLMPDGGYLLAGKRTSSWATHPEYHGLVWRTNSNGTLLWEKTYKKEPGKSTVVNSIQYLADGTILVGATSNELIRKGQNYYYKEDPWFIIADSTNGNIVKDTLLNKGYAGGVITGGGNIFKDKNGGYFHWGQLDTIVIDSVLFNEVNFFPYFAHLNNDFSVNRIKVWPPLKDSLKRYITIVKQTQDSGYILVGSALEMFTTWSLVGWAAKINKHGFVEWDNAYFLDINFDGYLVDAAETPDGGFVLTGTHSDGDSASWRGYDMWLLRVDSNGCLIPGCTPTTIKKSPKPQQNFPVKIYPNPTTGAFNIEIPQRGSYTIRVMNMLGSTVYEGKMADEQKKSILLDSNLPPGNYTIHISGDGLRHVERITLTK